MIGPLPEGMRITTSSPGFSPVSEASETVRTGIGAFGRTVASPLTSAALTPVAGAS